MPLKHLLIKELYFELYLISQVKLPIINLFWPSPEYREGLVGVECDGSESNLDDCRVFPSRRCSPGTPFEIAYLGCYGGTAEGCPQAVLTETETDASENACDRLQWFVCQGRPKRSANEWGGWIKKRWNRWAKSRDVWDFLWSPWCSTEYCTSKKEELMTECPSRRIFWWNLRLLRTTFVHCAFLVKMDVNTNTINI